MNKQFVRIIIYKYDNVSSFYYTIGLKKKFILMYLTELTEEKSGLIDLVSNLVDRFI